MLAMSSAKCIVIRHPSIFLSFLSAFPIGIFTATHQGAACDVATCFGLTVSRIGTLAC